MALTSTHTYTSYFTPEDVAPLEAEFEKLVDDWRDRMEHVSAEARCSGNERIEAARLALVRLTDVVIE